MTDGTVVTDIVADAPVGFQVRLTNFEGPFDLLLTLIGQHRLDVTEVALHTVTDDFIGDTALPPRERRLRSHSVL